ncbi:MAG: Excinuclease ABC C subunit domain protein [Parcubacteria group bacterium GW2011_GWB1_45_9]|nr:MAG: Excinuclease ABC C subunit domain protein [Parcubacteria group bacterium GW2011_GWB1_45_9]
MRKIKKRKSLKGALIKGMSRNLPSEILIDPVFKKKLEALMRGYAGIYALYKSEKLYYVGLTGNLHGRIKWHLKDRHSGKWNHFKIFRIQKVQYLKDIETLIHHIAETRGNRVKGQVPRNSDFNHVLREVLREYEKRIKPIKRALK